MLNDSVPINLTKRISFGYLASTLQCVVKLCWVREGAVELASDVALEHGPDLTGGLALGGTPREVAAGAVGSCACGSEQWCARPCSEFGRRRG